MVNYFVTGNVYLYTHYIDTLFFDNLFLKIKSRFKDSFAFIYNSSLVVFIYRLKSCALLYKFFLLSNFVLFLIHTQQYSKVTSDSGLSNPS